MGVAPEKTEQGITSHENPERFIHTPPEPAKEPTYSVMHPTGLSASKITADLSISCTQTMHVLTRNAQEMDVCALYQVTGTAARAVSPISARSSGTQDPQLGQGRYTPVRTDKTLASSVPDNRETRAAPIGA